MGKNSCVLFWNELKPAATVLISVSLPLFFPLHIFLLLLLLPADGVGSGWWRGKRGPFTPLSWSLSADRMNLSLTLEVTDQLTDDSCCLFSFLLNTQSEINLSWIYSLLSAVSCPDLWPGRLNSPQQTALTEHTLSDSFCNSLTMNPLVNRQKS